MSTFKICLSSSIFVLLLLTGCAGQLDTANKAVPITEEFQELVSDYHKKGVFQGSILVAKDGQVIYQAGFGLADMEWNIPNSIDTKYGIASLTKSFTALRALQLMEQGIVNLDDPVSKYLPEFAGREAAEVTLRELITHTSGFKEHVDLDIAAMPSSLLTASDSMPMIEKMKTLLPYAKITGERGKFHYSNDGYALLGWIIEAASSMSFSDNMQQLTAAAGMHETGIAYHKQIIPKRARSYQQEGGGWVNSPYEDASENQGAGSLYSTVGDLLKLDIALRNGALLSENSLQLINNSYVDSWTVFGFPNFAYGWWIKNDEVLGRVAMHPGASSRFSSVMIRGIDKDFTLVALSNVSSIANMNIYTEGLLELVKNSIFVDEKTRK